MLVGLGMVFIGPAEMRVEILNSILRMKLVKASMVA